MSSYLGEQDTLNIYSSSIARFKTPRKWNWTKETEIPAFVKQDWKNERCYGGSCY